MRTLAAVLTILAASLLTACGGTFDPASRIDRERVLGARSEVQGDAERAWPMPGETTNLTFLVADPQEDAKPLSWMMAACLSATGSAAAPMCDGEPFAIAAGDDAPAFAVTVPPESALGATSVLLVAGVVCADGAPMIDGDGMPYCAGDDAEETPVTMSVLLQRDAETNHNPDLSDDVVTIDGAVWPVSTPADPTQPCAASALPQIGEGDEVAIGLTVDAGDRETYVDGGETVREALQISHFVTAGKLESQFSMLENESNEIDVTWKAPRSVSGSGELVRLHLVARDRRGGVAWTARELCVVPD